MKRKLQFIALILFFVTPLKVYSQNIWFETGATWVHTLVNDLGFGYLETKVVGDTIINGQPCRKLARNYKIYDDNGNIYVEGNANDLYVYAKTSGEKTYKYNSNLGTFELLYDMNKTAGETVTYPYPKPSGLATNCPDNIYSVIENGIINISGLPLKYYKIEPTPTTNYYMTGNIIERMGSDTFSFFSYVMENQTNPALCPTGNSDMNFESAFRCYHDSVIDYKDKFVKNDFAGNCYYPGVPPLLNVKESSTSQNDFIIYPNPADKVIVIRRNENSNTTAKVTNTVGQLTTTYEIKGKKAEINVSSLPTGIYFISIDGTTKKMIINHK